MLPTVTRRRPRARFGVLCDFSYIAVVVLGFGLADSTETAESVVVLASDSRPRH